MTGQPSRGGAGGVAVGAGSASARTSAMAQQGNFAVDSIGGGGYGTSTMSGPTTMLPLALMDKAVAVARDALENAAQDNQSDAEQFRTDLFNIARTTLSSKLLTQHKDFFAKICVLCVHVENTM